MEGRASWSPDGPDRCARQVRRWRDAGPTHLSIDTMHTGQVGVGQHLATRETAVDLVGPLGD
jgi:hypothetical protein